MDVASFETQGALAGLRVQLEEAENERMHLLTFIRLREPGLAFRAAVLVAQGVFFNTFFVAYVVNPKACHRFVGYVEEEAVRTYATTVLGHLGAVGDCCYGRCAHWRHGSCDGATRLALAGTPG